MRNFTVWHEWDAGMRARGLHIGCACAGIFGDIHSALQAWPNTVPYVEEQARVVTCWPEAKRPTHRHEQDATCLEKGRSGHSTKALLNSGCWRVLPPSFPASQSLFFEKQKLRKNRTTSPMTQIPTFESVIILFSIQFWTRSSSFMDEMDAQPEVQASEHFCRVLIWFCRRWWPRRVPNISVAAAMTSLGQISEFKSESDESEDHFRRHEIHLGDGHTHRHMCDGG